MTATSKTAESIERTDSRPSGQDAPTVRLPTDQDVEILVETRNQIRGLVQEITALVDGGVEPDAFYAGYLPRVVAALAGNGGALWLLNDRRQLEQKYQMQWSQTVLASDPAAAQRHARLLRDVLAAGESTVIPAQSGTAGAAGNPTDDLLLLGVLRVDQTPIGLIEVFQRSGAAATTQRGYLRFIEQMSELGSRYLRNRRLERLAEQQVAWQRQDKFIRAVHRSLDYRGTLFALANEGRRVVGCDRVAVAICTGNRCEVQVVSGSETLERRAEQVQYLSRLAAAVVRMGRPFWYGGDSTEIPAELNKVLPRYLELSQVKSLGIVPLCRSGDAGPVGGAEDAGNGRQPAADDSSPFGVLLCEQLGGERLSEAQRERCEWIAAHGADSVAAARQHSRIFLLPLWTMLGELSTRAFPVRLAKWIVAVGVLAALVGGLCWTPASFTLTAKGALVPESRHEIFAPSDGILEELFLPANPEEIVAPNQVLARLSNNDLLVAIEDLEGQYQQWTTRHQNLSHSWSEQKNLVDKLQVERDLSEATAMLESLQRQLEIKRRDLSQLEIRAPVRGRIVNWQLQQTLLRRPVRTGQNLMTMVAPETAWVLELDLPERRVAHFLRAAAQDADPLQVRFTLASLPGQELVGTVVEWDRRLEVHTEQGNCLRVRVHFDKQAVSEELLKTGTRATAQIECGQRSLGYVWFRELIETVHAAWLMWF